MCFCYHLLRPVGKFYVIGQTGLKGESLNLHTATGSSAVKWSQGSFLSKKQSLTWYKVRMSFLQNAAVLLVLYKILYASA